jgi:hypothetical protein
MIHFRTVLDSLARYKSYSKCRPVPSMKKKLAAVPTLFKLLLRLGVPKSSFIPCTERH